MDDSVVLVAASCAALAVLVWLMWMEANKQEWGGRSQSEKSRWKKEEDLRKKR